MREKDDRNEVRFSDLDSLNSDDEPITGLELEYALAKGTYPVTTAMVKAAFDAISYSEWRGFEDLDDWPDCAKKIYVAMCLAQKKYP